MNKYSWTNPHTGKKYIVEGYEKHMGLGHPNPHKEFCPWCNPQNPHPKPWELKKEQ